MEDKSVISHQSSSNLLELAAADDLSSFIHEVEERGINVNSPSFWYGRSSGSKKMALEERTPIMIASLYGSTHVLKYIIQSCNVDVNKPCGGTTALHCAAAAGASSSVEAVEILLAAGSDINAVDANGKKAGELIAPCVQSRRSLELLLNSGVTAEEDVCKKKEYIIPGDVCLPDINDGVYGSDEFRMYSFKVKPCSRAYSHDWTECPFAHPGENARRRDPRKYGYTCVPCPEFKKGSCSRGDGCEYAHGVFESWLHPAQYRTRLCKDEVVCARKVCFFAHRREELRPLYAATGSALPAAAASLDLAAPMSPPVTSSSPMWQSRVNLSTPPALQLPCSRLKSSSSSPSHYGRVGDLKPTNLNEFFDPTMLSQLQLQLELELRSRSPRPNTNHLRASYPTTNASSRKASPYGFDSSAAVAAAVMNARSSAFSKRSQSFVDRGGVAYRSGHSPSKLADWGSPDGKVDWGFNGDDASKLRKSASFGIRTAAAVNPEAEWGGGGGVHEMMMPLWMDQMYMEQEQMVA